jgi:hypothetical protein
VYVLYPFGKALFVLFMEQRSAKSVLHRLQIKVYKLFTSALISAATHTHTVQNFYETKFKPINPILIITMQFTTTFMALAAFFAAGAVAASTPVQRDVGSAEGLERRITDVGNPANLINCPPGGGADACHLEQPVSRSS